jgi:hypothetical protein
MLYDSPVFNDQVLKSYPGWENISLAHPEVVNAVNRKNALPKETAEKAYKQRCELLEKFLTPLVLGKDPKPRVQLCSYQGFSTIEEILVDGIHVGTVRTEITQEVGKSMFLKTSLQLVEKKDG